MKKLLFILLLTSCGSKLLAQESNLFDSVNTRKFARYLITAHHYTQAAEEFERLYFLSNNNPAYLGSLLYSLRKANQDAMVLQRFSASQMLPDAAYKEYVFCMLKLNKSNDAIASINQRANLDTNTKNILIATSYMEQYKWSEAKRLYARTALPQHEKIMEVVQAAEHAKKKSAVAAAAMSAVIPGLGKLYTGNKKDALISFIFVGINSFQSYRYFHKKGVNSVGAWVFGSLATGFYLGNIYGSYKAALHKNKKINDAYKKQITELTDLD